MTTETTFDDVVGDLDEAKTSLNNVEAAISSAESCEKADDLRVNIDEALGWAQDLVKKLNELKKAAKTVKDGE